MKLDDLLPLIQEKYKEVTILQNIINSKYVNREVIINEEYLEKSFLSEGYGFKFEYINIEDDEINITYWTNEEDEPPTEYEEDFTIEEFLKHCTIKKD